MPITGKSGAEYTNQNNGGGMGPLAMILGVLIVLWVIQ